MQKGKFRITDLAGFRGELRIGECRLGAAEEVLGTGCCDGMGNEEECPEEESKEVVGRSHSVLLRQTRLERSFAGPFHTIKASVLRG
jgi:hypothetical protein